MSDGTFEGAVVRDASFAKGQAYLAFKGLRRRCMIMLLTDTTNPGFVARFYREAQVMANPDHTTIQHVHDVATTKDSRPYFFMEFVDGKSLGEHVADEGGTLSISEACRLTADAAEGLAAAHEVGIVHRDVKLANLLVNKKNQIKVIDFGIARKTIEEESTVPANIASSKAKVAPKPTVGTTPTKVISSTKTSASPTTPGVSATGAKSLNGYVSSATPSSKSLTPAVSSTAAVDSPF